MSWLDTRLLLEIQTDGELCTVHFGRQHAGTAEIGQLVINLEKMELS